MVGVDIGDEVSVTPTDPLVAQQLLIEEESSGGRFGPPDRQHLPERDEGPQNIGFDVAFGLLGKGAKAVGKFAIRGRFGGITLAFPQWEIILDRINTNGEK